MSKEFGCEISCSVEDRQEIWSELSRIIGFENVDREMPDVADVAEKLGSAINAIDVLTPLLNSHQLGYREQTAELEKAGGELVSSLADNPAFESPGKAIAFLKDLSDRLTVVQRACADAAGELKSVHGKSGAKRLHYYDQFTELLVSLLKRYELSAKLQRRNGRVPSGPLYRLAKHMEVFLPIDLRCETDEARFSRLRSSLKILKR